MKPTLEHQLDQQMAACCQQLKLGRVTVCAQQCDRIISARPDYIPARLMAARISIDRDQANEALAHLDAIEWYRACDQVILTPPQQRRSMLLRSRAMLQLGLDSQAMQILRTILDRWPRYAPARRCIAHLYLQAEQYDHAIEAVRALIDTDGACGSSCLLAADIYERAGRPADAIDALIAADQGELRPSLRVARLLAANDEHAAADDVYRALYDRDPHDPDLLIEWLGVLEQIGAEQTMHRLLTRAIREGSMNDCLRLEFARHLIRVGRFLQAGRQLWRLGRGKSSFAGEVWSLLMVVGACEARQKLFAKCADRLSQVMPSEAKRERLTISAWQLAALGMVHQRVGNLASSHEQNLLGSLLHESQVTFEDYLAEHSGHADAHYHLSVCHDMLDQPDAASDCLEHALELNPGYLAAAQARVVRLLGEYRYAAALAVADAAQAARGTISHIRAMRAAVHVARGDQTAAHDALGDPALAPPQHVAAFELSVDILESAGANEQVQNWTIAFKNWQREQMVNTDLAA